MSRIAARLQLACALGSTAVGAGWEPMMLTGYVDAVCTRFEEDEGIRQQAEIDLEREQAEVIRKGRCPTPFPGDALTPCDLPEGHQGCCESNTLQKQW